MRRILASMAMVLLCASVGFAAEASAAADAAKAAKPAKAAKAKKAKAETADAVTPAKVEPAATAGFDAEGFRKHFVAGIAPRPGMPAISPQDVIVEGAEKAASFAGTDIYMVRGKLGSGGQSQPFNMFVSADGRYYISDIIDMQAGKSILKQARDSVRATDLASLGHTILKGGGAHPVTFVSDPFCPYCRHAFAFLLERKGVISELRLAHYPLTSHPGADIACALMAWAVEKAPDKALDFVRYAYTDLAVPKLKDKSEPELKKAWSQVAEDFLKRFPELKELGADGEAIVAALQGSTWVVSVQQDMARATSMNIDGTPIIFVGEKRVEGFDPERLGALLK